MSCVCASVDWNGFALSPHPTIPSEDQNDSINNQAFTQIWLCSLGSVLGSAKNDMIGSRGRPTMDQATPLSISRELHFLARLDHFAPIKEISTCDLIQGGERGELEIGWWKDFLLSLI